MIDAAALAAVKKRYELLSPTLNERDRRLMVAAEALALGSRSVAGVSRVTGVDHKAIARGIKDLQNPDPAIENRVRRPGGGRKRATEKDPALLAELDKLVEPTVKGDPISPLRWTTKSVRKLAMELTSRGHAIQATLVRRLLVRDLKYRLQSNRKTLAGKPSHPDRNAQFEHINAKATAQLAAEEPVISVDTKKKELIGPFKNGGKEWRPQGRPEEVLDHDFKIDELGRASPYGIYDIGKNAGYVNVGIDHDTAEFAVESIRRWWNEMGRAVYSTATTLMITADCGGSNGYRTRLWKLELQRLSDETGLSISVCHFPPGTSKWNRIEHRMFSAISQNWRGRPLVSIQVIVELIGATTSTKGLTVRSVLDTKAYDQGRKVSDAEMSTINVSRDAFHGEWNYTISPRDST